MNRICISLALGMLYGMVVAQNAQSLFHYNKKFINHLTVNNLNEEKLYYLKKITLEDSLPFRIEIAAEKG